MSKPVIVLFDWKDSPEHVIKELAEAVRDWPGTARPVINRVHDTGEDTAIAVLADRKMLQSELKRFIDAETGDITG